MHSRGEKLLTMASAEEIEDVPSNVPDTQVIPYYIISGERYIPPWSAFNSGIHEVL